MLAESRVLEPRAHAQRVFLQHVRAGIMNTTLPLEIVSSKVPFPLQRLGSSCWDK